jgi:hypothetical protein
MYNKLTSLLQSKAEGKIRVNDKDVVFLYEGMFNNFSLTVKVIRVSGQKKNFIVEYKGENIVFKSEDKAVKYLVGVLDPESVPKTKPRKPEKSSMQSANIYRQVLDGYKLVFFTDSKNEMVDDAELPINADMDYQVGYIDFDMPYESALEEMARGLTPEISSNWRSGCINNALSELGVRERYRLIYIFDGYFCYDKEEDKVITLKELFKIIPNKLIAKYDLGPRIMQPEVEE